MAQIGLLFLFISRLPKLTKWILDIPFRLFANCIPVKGVKRSTICDLQRGRFHIIPNSLYDILVNYEGVTLRYLSSQIDEGNQSVLEEYFKFLIEQEYIFFSEEENFPKLDLTFLLSRIYF